MKKPLNFLQGKNRASSKDGAEKGVGGLCAREWSRDRLLRGGGSREGLERARQTQCFFRIIHLAKLNPKGLMNYLDYL